MADASVMFSVANFVTKLYDLVEQPDTDGHIHWGATGESFLVLNTTQFAQLVLPMHFKHDNLRSFERQLNIYGFQRCIAQPTEHGLEFFHPKFRREQRNLLVEIKRSQKRQLSALADAAPEPSRVAEELAGLESVQQTMLTLQADMHASEQEVVRLDRMATTIAAARAKVHACAHARPLGLAQGIAQGVLAAEPWPPQAAVAAAPACGAAAAPATSGTYAQGVLISAAEPRTDAAAAVPSGLQGVVPNAPRNALQGMQGMQGVQGVQGMQGVQGVQGMQGLVLPSPSEVRQKHAMATPPAAPLDHALAANLHAAPSAAPYALPGLYDARIAAASAAPFDLTDSR